MVYSGLISQPLTRTVHADGDGAWVHDYKNLIKSFPCHSLTIVSEGNLVVDTLDHLTDFIDTVSSGGECGIHFKTGDYETLKDLGKTLTVSVAAGGHCAGGQVLRFLLVQRTNTWSGASGEKGYVVIENNVSQFCPVSGELNVKVSRV
jgi:hypothetical protein